MGGHPRGHAHRRPADLSRRLRLAILLNGAFIALELAVGLRIGSLALVSDAWHNLTDVLALGIAWFAMRQVRRPADAGRTFGYHRAGILAAVGNSVLLAGVTLNLLLQGAQRLWQPPATSPDGHLIVAVAAAGVLVNGVAALGLRRAGRDLNLRTAFLHLLADALVSAGVVLAGAVIVATGWRWPDPVASLLVALFVLAAAWGVLREALNVLMEGTPRGLELREVTAAIGRVPGVRGVHHVHLWALSADVRALSCHIVIDDQPISAAGLLVAELQRTLRERFAIGHATLQLESEVGAGALLSIQETRAG